MRYFIAHVLSGNPKKYHERVVSILARTYKIKIPKRHTPPHLTFKAPFETDLMGIVQVEKALRSFARAHSAPRYTLRGFGRFGFKTLYLDVYKSPDTVRFVRACVRYLNAQVSWLPKGHREGDKPHVSIARHLDRKTSDRIWRAIKHFVPELDARLDTLAVLKHVGDEWVVRTLIRIPRTQKLPLPE